METIVLGVLVMLAYYGFGWLVRYCDWCCRRGAYGREPSAKDLMPDVEISGTIRAGVRTTRKVKLVGKLR